MASYSRDTAGSVSVSTIDIDTSKSKLYDANGQAGLIDKSRTVNTTSASLSALDITSLTDSIADQQALKDYASLADDVLTNITIAASDLGAAHSRIASQAHFISSLMDSVSRGIGSLVDADMNLESTRLQSLQVQQRLGLQSLSIANINSSMILKLFA